MKNHLHSPRAGARRGWRRPLLIGLVAVLSLYAVSAAAQSYDALRLYAEALYEISQKSVFQKGEEEMIYGSMRGMMNSLDPDSAFLTPQEYQEYLKGSQKLGAEAGLELLYKDNLLTVASAIDDGPAARAGLRAGDHILKIDGKIVRNLSGQEVARRFQGTSGTPIKVQVIRNGLVKPLDLTITLGTLTPGTVTLKPLPNSFAYVRVRFFTPDTPAELAAAIKSIIKQEPPVRGIVLDLRNNARGSLEQAVRAGSVLLGDREIVSTKGRIPEAGQTYQGKGRELAFKPALPLVVLVDQGTGRAAEILAGALKDDAGATLVGTKTLGLCGLTKTFPLQDGSALVMTVAQCYTPKGRKIQGKGMEPDVEMKTEAGAATAAKEAPRPALPEQDPWVIKAMEILKTAKPGLTPQKKSAS